MDLFRYSAQAVACCLSLVAVAAPAPAAAQVQVHVGVPVPQIHVQVGGPLVYVAPGIWVLPDSDDEVFYNGGWYWVRGDGYWHRSRGRHSGWVAIDEGRVPRTLVRMTPGHYRSYQAPARARTMAPRGWEVPREVRQEREFVPTRMHRGDVRRDTMSGRQERRMYQGATPAPVLVPVPMHRGRKGKGNGKGRGHDRGYFMSPIAQRVAEA